MLEIESRMKEEIFLSPATAGDHRWSQLAIGGHRWWWVQYQIQAYKSRSRILSASWFLSRTPLSLFFIQLFQHLYIQGPALNSLLLEIPWMDMSLNKLRELVMDNKSDMLQSTGSQSWTCMSDWTELPAVGCFSGKTLTDAQLLLVWKKQIASHHLSAFSRRAGEANPNALGYALFAFLPGALPVRAPTPPPIYTLRTVTSTASWLTLSAVFHSHVCNSPVSAPTAASLHLARVSPLSTGSPGRLRSSVYPWLLAWLALRRCLQNVSQHQVSPATEADGLMGWAALPSPSSGRTQVGSSFQTIFPEVNWWE